MSSLMQKLKPRRLGDGDLAIGRGVDRRRPVEQPGHECIRVLGGELVGRPMAPQAGDDDAGPVEPVPLNPGCIQVFAGLADGARGRRGL